MNESIEAIRQIILGAIGLLAVWWFIASFAVGIAAAARDRSFMGWTGISLVMTPMLATLLLIGTNGRVGRDRR